LRLARPRLPGRLLEGGGDPAPRGMTVTLETGDRIRLMDDFGDTRSRRLRVAGTGGGGFWEWDT